MKAAADTPIELAKITMLTEQERIAFIEGVRHRREEPIRRYKELQEKLKAAKIEKLNAESEKRLAQFIKALEAANKAITKLDELSKKLRAIEIEMEIL